MATASNIVFDLMPHVPAGCCCWLIGPAGLTTLYLPHFRTRKIKKKTTTSELPKTRDFSSWSAIQHRLFALPMVSSSLSSLTPDSPSPRCALRFLFLFLSFSPFFAAFLPVSPDKRSLARWYTIVHVSRSFAPTTRHGRWTTRTETREVAPFAKWLRFAKEEPSALTFSS